MNPRDTFIVAYQFKSYYDKESDWQLDFAQFCFALRQFDLANSTMRV